jgi:ADP-ribosyl-[dinitrogen reductase] hydrolase
MLLELAIGDAYGAGFEFASSEKITALNDLSRYYPHELGVIPGAYTDDTQMTLALCELSLEGIEWTPLSIADKFVQVFKRDPRNGYAKGFHEVLKTLNSGRQFLERIDGRSNRNGAAMRAIPCGFFLAEGEVLEKAAMQAKLTHNTGEGVRSAEAIALAAHYFWKQLGTAADLPRYLSEKQGYEWTAEWAGPVPCKGDETVVAVLATLTSSRSMKSMLKHAVAFGGDVDSVAALALGLAALSSEYHSDLPAVLYEGLENGSYGRDYLSRVGAALLKSRPA